jgi:hypothetical protein
MRSFLQPPFFLQGSFLTLDRQTDFREREAGIHLASRMFIQEITQDLIQAFPAIAGENKARKNGGRSGQLL